MVNFSTEQANQLIRNRNENMVKHKSNGVKKLPLVKQTNENNGTSVTFKIFTVLPNLNAYIEAERTNRYIAASMKKKATQNVKLACFNFANEVSPIGLYDLCIEWVVPNNRMDSDNVFFAVKFINDGMVHAGLIADDNRKHIRNIDNRIKTVKGEYCVTVTLIRVK